MARLEAQAAWLFSCLGIVLLAASILVVPATAFAEAGDDCVAKCVDDPDPPSCTYACCETACGGSGNLCFQGCMQGQLSCSGHGGYDGCNLNCRINIYQEACLPPKTCVTKNDCALCKCNVFPDPKYGGKNCFCW